MDPNQQNQQPMGSPVSSDQSQTQEVDVNQQQTASYTEETQSEFNQTVPGPQPMSSEVSQTSYDVNVLGAMPTTSQPLTDQPSTEVPAEENSAVPLEQVNPVESSSQYVVGQEVSGGTSVVEDTQSGEENNPPQGI